MYSLIQGEFRTDNKWCSLIMLYLVNDPRYKQYLTGNRRARAKPEQEAKKEEPKKEDATKPLTN